MSTRAKPALGVALLVALALGATLWAQTASGQSLLRSAGLVSEPDRYTELSFAEPERVPDAVTGGRVIPAAIRIRSREAEARRYAWQIVQRRADGSGDRRLASGTARLDPGRARTIRTRIRPTCEGRRMSIQVRLARPRHVIGLWVDCRAGAVVP